MGEFARILTGAPPANYTQPSPSAAVKATTPSVDYQQKEAAEAFTVELLRAVEKQWLQAMHLPQEVSWVAEDVMARQMAKALAPSLVPRVFPAHNPGPETTKS